MSPLGLMLQPRVAVEELVVLLGPVEGLRVISRGVPVLLDLGNQIVPVNTTERPLSMAAAGRLRAEAQPDHQRENERVRAAGRQRGAGRGSGDQYSKRNGYGAKK